MEDSDPAGYLGYQGGIPIGAFSDSVAEYLDEYSLAYAESTIKDRRRELMRLCSTVESLRSVGSISTEDPSAMTLADVQVIAAHLKRTDLSSNTRGHLLGRLNMLCKFEGNMAVEFAKVRYPTLFPPKKETRLGVLEPKEVATIIRFSEGEHDYRGLRSCVSVLISLAAGLRPQEVRYVMDIDFSEDLSELRVGHPKGGDSYGLVRVVPIHPSAVPVIRRYLDLFHSSGRSGFLFQGPRGSPVEGNTQRKWREYVEEGTGLDLDHRILRRTWGQSLLDRGVPEECVSVLLGHASTETTARYYARTRERAAIAEVRRSWSEKPSETVSREGVSR